MPTKQLATEIASAMDAASRDALAKALAELPADTTLGGLLSELGASRPAGVLRSMPLVELASLLGSHDASSNNGGSVQAKRRKTKAAPRRTRDSLVRAYVRKAGSARAEEIRAEVGGTPAELRKALFELKEQKLVRRTGKGRATVWHWRG